MLTRRSEARNEARVTNSHSSTARRQLARRQLARLQVQRVEAAQAAERIPGLEHVIQQLALVGAWRPGQLKPDLLPAWTAAALHAFPGEGGCTTSTSPDCILGRLTIGQRRASVRLTNSVCEVTGPKQGCQLHHTRTQKSKVSTSRKYTCSASRCVAALRGVSSVGPGEAQWRRSAGLQGHAQQQSACCRAPMFCRQGKSVARLHQQERVQGLAHAHRCRAPPPCCRRKTPAAEAVTASSGDAQAPSAARGSASQRLPFICVVCLPL